jgi:histidyl-tRNA synthetase
MFTFEDKAGRSLTLRPEGTASVCRAYVEHGMHKRPQPVKVWYWGPFFRHEAPQAGRFRQFTQVGAEALGTDEPSADAELVLLLAGLLEGCRDVRLRISSLGNPRTRESYRTELGDWLRAREDDLAEPVRARLDLNPLRAFDSDDPATQAVMAEAPKLLDRLDDQDAEHFAEVRALLDKAGLAYEVDPGLVRGLDYYTRTVFEFESGALGAQAALGGGGRYDGLVELLGGPPTPGVGFAAGIERILLAQGEDPCRVLPDVFVAVAKPERRREAFELVRALRAADVAAELDHAGRSLKGQLKQANRLEVSVTVIMGDVVELKDMWSGEQREVAGVADVLKALEA